MQGRQLLGGFNRQLMHMQRSKGRASDLQASSSLVATPCLRLSTDVQTARMPQLAGMRRLVSLITAIWEGWGHTACPPPREMLPVAAVSLRCLPGGHWDEEAAWSLQLSG